jgi:hypothetical protein
MHISGKSIGSFLQIQRPKKMKSAFCLGVSLLGLLASVASVSAVETEARVVTSRALRIAAVRDDIPAANWYVVQHAFGTSMAESLATPGSAPMPVKVITVTSPNDAAHDLRNGKFDAILVMSERLPSELRRADLYSTKVVSEIGVPVRVFHLVIQAQDTAAVEALTSAFQKATSSVAFQDTVGRMGALKVFADSRDPVR